MPKKTNIIGITGPIACGKNEICRILRRSGAYIIDVDTVGHEILRQRRVINKLTAAFGDKVLDKGKNICRSSLGEMVFGYKKNLLKLNKITHPVILKEVLKRIKSTKKKHTVINAAVLKEIGLAKYCDRIWFVASSKANRTKRLLSKGFGRKEIFARIASQKSTADYVKEADIVIRNNGSKSELARKVERLISRYL